MGGKPFFSKEEIRPRGSFTMKDFEVFSNDNEITQEIKFENLN